MRGGAIMKKAFSVIVIILFLLILIGCGKSEEVIAVEKTIDAIGSVTLTSLDRIEEAEKMYSSLSEEDQNKVENYNLLLAARAEYDNIPKPVELTAGNVQSYLSVSLDYSKPEVYTKMGITFGESNVSLKMYPIKGGTFENVELTIEVPLMTLWTVSSSDKAYDEANASTLTVKIKLPASGTYEESHKIRGLGTGGSVIDPSVGSRYKIKSVKGTFIPNS